MDKLPPFEKIYEAWSVFADGRLDMHEGFALIDSSDRSKKYEVSWEGNTYASSDSATYWQGYPGYPVLAVWMEQGILLKAEACIPYFKDIPWKEINAKHKRNYAEAAQEVLASIQAEGGNVKEIVQCAEDTYEVLKTLDLQVRKGRTPHWNAMKKASEKN